MLSDMQHQINGYMKWWSLDKNLSTCLWKFHVKILKVMQSATVLHIKKTKVDIYLR